MTPQEIQQQKIQEEAGKRYPMPEDIIIPGIISDQRADFTEGANFALSMILKDLDKHRNEFINISGLRQEVVEWKDIEALLGKIDHGF